VDRCDFKSTRIQFTFDKMSKLRKETIDFLSTLRVLLIHGLIEKHQIISWADKGISNTDYPEEFHIELSLIGARTTKEICDLLDELSGNFKSLTAGRALVGLIANKIEREIIDYKKGFEILNSIRRTFQFSELERDYISHTDNAIDLAINQIWGKKDEVEHTAKSFLKCYEGFTLENVERWDQISSDVNEKLQGWKLKSWKEPQ
jgi:hypothetical protein